MTRNVENTRNAYRRACSSFVDKVIEILNEKTNLNLMGMLQKTINSKDDLHFKVAKKINKTDKCTVSFFSRNTNSVHGMDITFFYDQTFLITLKNAKKEAPEFKRIRTRSIGKEMIEEIKEHFIEEIKGNK
jgi:hypothetical protein